jgi:hypothetical protein
VAAALVRAIVKLFEQLVDCFLTVEDQHQVEWDGVEEVGQGERLRLLDPVCLGAQVHQGLIAEAMHEGARVQGVPLPLVVSGCV